MLWAGMHHNAKFNQYLTIHWSYRDFFIFQDGGQILSKSVNPLRSYCNFLIFQDGGRPPSWICLGQIWTTDEGYLVVFITVQNLIAIDTVVSKI